MDAYEARQFGKRQFDGTNLSASQFGRKINFDFLSLALKQQQKSFVTSLRKLQLFTNKSENSHLIVKCIKFRDVPS